MVQTRRARAAAITTASQNDSNKPTTQNTSSTLEPSPKKRARRLSPRKVSKSITAPKVTPSPKTNNTLQSRRSTCLWLTHDELLKGNQGQSSSYPVSEEEQKWQRIYRNLQDTDSSQNIKFKRVMQQLLTKDPLFQKEFGVEHEYEQLRWSRWAVQLSTYPKKRIKAILEEYQADMKLHSDLLKELTHEISERRQGGKRFYLRALSCIFFDSFSRCHIPFPPLPDWDVVVKEDVTRKEVYKKQLRAWQGFKSRAFAIVRAVILHPRKREGYVLPPISPLVFRGEMLPMKANCTNEEEVIDYSYDYYDDDDSEDGGNREKVEEPDNDDLEEPQCNCRRCNDRYLYCW